MFLFFMKWSLTDRVLLIWSQEELENRFPLVMSIILSGASDGIIGLHQGFKIRIRNVRWMQPYELVAGVHSWQIAKAEQLCSRKSQLCFPLQHTSFSPTFSFWKIWMWTSAEHMRDNWVWNPSPVSRSSASPGHRGCGIGPRAHHLRDLQLPHLQVSSISSSWRFLSVLLLAATAERERKRERERREMFETGFMGRAALGASVVFTRLLPQQRLSRWRR